MGKKRISTELIRKECNRGISAFLQLIDEPSVRYAVDREIDDFLRECAIGVWAQGETLTPEHVEAFRAIGHKAAAEPPALYWEMVERAGRYAGFQTPDFFEKLVRRDRECGQTNSRKFLELFSLLLLLFAAVDERVSEAEGKFISQCYDVLAERCMKNGIPAEQKTINIMDYVTKQSPVPQKTTAKSGDEGKGKTTPEEKKENAARDLNELMAELEELCGLTEIKRDVKGLISLVKVRKLRKEHGLPVPPMSLHLVFMGNPGTGKTTVARLLAQIYHSIGVLSKGQLVEVDRSGLVAGYVGQTAIKTKEVIASALGGVLFIDEAYALVSGEGSNDFGREAVEALLKEMEDHRDDLIVIVAGYTNLMERFIQSNPGLESRFNKYFYFKDYTGEELHTIFCSMCRKNGYQLNEESEAIARRKFQTLYEERDENFGNAREVRNCFEKTIARHANRVAEMEKPTREELITLIPDDLQEER